MTESNYRAGIIGLGFIGGADQVSGDALGQVVTNLDGTHFAALANNPRVELVSGSSRDPGRCERFEQRSGAQTYSDWRQMLATESLDIVSVATYAPQHAEMVVTCAERGAKAIYCEKPIATQLTDAEKMVTACDESGSLLAINHNRRFNPNYIRLRNFIADGGLGDLTSASIQWGHGRLGNVGTHMIDTIRMVTAREVVAVSAMLDLTGRPDCRGPQFQDPGGWGMMRLENDLIVTVDAADNACVPGQISVNGTEGRAITGRDEVTIEYWDGKTETWPSVRNEASSMDRALSEIVSCLDGGGTFSCPADESVRTLEAIVAFHASHAKNAAWVTLPLHGSDREIEVKSG